MSTKNLIRGGILQYNPTKIYFGKGIPDDSPNWMINHINWLQNKKYFKNRIFPVSLLLDTNTKFVLEEDSIPKIDFLAIYFSIFTDGRGYSLAQLIREKFFWKKELRAIGDVLVDTVCYLAQVGFDSFLIKTTHEPKKALNKLYQYNKIQMY